MAFVPPTLLPHRSPVTSPTAVSPRRAPLAMSAPTSPDAEKRGILMLCLGNICRSPAAEAVMNGVLAKRNLGHRYFVDSCGTGGGSPNWYLDNGFSHHEGAPPDPRMRAAAERRGLTLDGASRPLTPADFDRFHLIVAMDDSNIDSIHTARAHWGVNNPSAQVALLSSFSKEQSFKGKPVPDPYWSGPSGFDHALDLIETACDGLADHLEASPDATV